MEKIVLQMMNFQHFYKIKGACATNAKCMSNYLKKTYPDKKIEVYPAIVTSDEGVRVHLIILADEALVDNEVNTKLLDPSYDVFSLENKRYYLNIKEFVDAIENPADKQNELRNLGKDFMKYLDCANEINSGTFENFNAELYNKQTEYVDLKLNLTVA
jgi:hypothetical protein